MRALDLFSGIGGFALAGRMVWGDEYEVVSFCEIDPFCQNVLRKHWPNVPINPDVRNLKGKDYGSIDILTGGFPCKQTSTSAAIHGNRSGLQGDDSKLYWEMLRIFRESRPDWGIVENVNGSESWSHQIKDSLEGIGYTVSKQKPTAEIFGAPHQRRRVFFVANASGKRLEIAWPRRTASIRNGAWASPPGNAWRASNPDSLRMANGVSRGLDRHRKQRIIALGNSIVPHVAAVIMQAIKDVEQIIPK